MQIRPGEDASVGSPSIQGIIFVVLRSCPGNRYVEALLRQLVHPDVIVHRDRTLHCTAAVRRFRACRRLTTKLPARVDERLRRRGCRGSLGQLGSA